MASDYRRDITEDLGTLARGLRRLDDISDQDLRSAIRRALGLEPDAPRLDATRRARLRRTVLATLRGAPGSAGIERVTIEPQAHPAGYDRGLADGDRARGGGAS